MKWIWVTKDDGRPVVVNAEHICAVVCLKGHMVITFQHPENYMRTKLTPKEIAALLGAPPPPEAGT